MHGCATVATGDYRRVFVHMAVTDVVRLNDSDTYDPAGFAQHGACGMLLSLHLWCAIHGVSGDNHQVFALVI
jgi:hypothetical protein